LGYFFQQNRLAESLPFYIEKITPPLLQISGTYVVNLNHYSPVITKNIPRLLKAIKITASEQWAKKYPKTTEGNMKPLQSSGSKKYPKTYEAGKHPLHRDQKKYPKTYEGKESTRRAKT